MGALEALQRRLVACRLCPRLVAHREAVAQTPPRRYRGERYWARPVPSLGPATARLLIVGLAPAAHGGNRTGRIFTGDESGNWLARALHTYGFATQPASRHRGDGFRPIDAYITAAIHCAPPDNRPSRVELETCARYLREELQLLRRVRVVIALGRIAFDAYLRTRRELGLAVPVPPPRFAHNRAWRLPDGVTLIASYHPSRQNTQTGRLTRPMFHAVFARTRRLLDAPTRRLGGRQAPKPVAEGRPAGFAGGRRLAKRFSRERDCGAPDRQGG